MTETDLHRIETELDIKLPPEYREVMLNFPIRFDCGNADSQLWDDPDALIRRNRELRTGRTVEGWFGYIEPPWPPHFFFIGGDVEESWALDLRQSPSRVLWVGHWDVSEYAGPYSNALPFTAWLRQYLDDFRNDGIDLSSEENPVERVPKGCLYAIASFFLVFLIAAAAVWLLK